MGKKTAIFAFNPEPGCFTHALLNVLDMHSKGWDVKLIIEGQATKLVKELSDENSPYSQVYIKVRDAGLITSVCRACAGKMAVLESVEQQGLELSGEMSGHPAMSGFIEQGYEIIVI